MKAKDRTVRRLKILPTMLCIVFLFISQRSTYGQATVALAPVPAQQFFSSTGVPLASACIYTYITGTSTPLATYTSGTGATQNSNPVILDIGGFGNIWLTNSAYRFTIYSKGLGGVQGTDCFSGVFQRTVDNVSAYAIINQAQNIFLTCASSDPSGSAGELGCRSDLGKPRFFYSIWDSLVTETGAATLTNKTLVNPVISSSTGAVLSSPNINGTVVTGPPATYLVMANDLVTGTTLNKLTKINPIGLAGFAILPLITDTGGITGVTVSGAGITGNATIQQNGSVSCVFDNATTSGNYIQISPTIAGDCHDAGVSYPNSGQVIGRSLATNVAIGTNIIDLFGPELNSSTFPKIVFNTASAITSTTLGLQTMLTPAASATYRFGGYIDLVAPGTACTGSTTVALNVVFTDPQAGASSNWVLLLQSGLAGTTTIASPQNIAVTSNGVQGAGPSVVPYTFRSKISTTIQYAVTYVAGANCAPGPTYQVFPILEQLTAN